jgi:MFS transporter, DHA3 family, tetracycline resistance protein
VYQSGYGAFFSMFAVLSSVYRIVQADLNPLELVLVGSALEAAVLVFEVPTGIVADLVSRRLSVVVGLAMVGAGFALEGLFPSFAPILAAQVLWGIGFTFTSGADVAWIADEVGEETATLLYVRGAQFDQGGSFVGGGAGVALGTFSLALPLIAAGVMMVALAVFLAIAMPEEGFSRPLHAEEAMRWRAARSVAATARGAAANVRRRPVLYLILAVALFHGASSEGFDRLSDLHLLRDTNFPVRESDVAGLAVVFGSLYGASLLLAIAGTQIVKRRVDFGTHRGIAGALSIINVLLIASVIVFALTGSFLLAVAMFFAVAVLREIQDPLTTAWINRDLDPRSRATVNSFAGQMDALGQVSAGPTLGVLALVRSVRAAIVASSLLLVPNIALYARALRRHGEPGHQPGDLGPEKREP